MINTVSSKRGCFLQVQPQYDQREKWEALAEKEGLTFEALELSAPPALNESGRFENCAEWYRASGRTTSVHGAFIDVNPASGDPLFRTVSQRRCRESCETALAVGARNVIFHSSCFPFLRGVYLDNWAGICACFYEELAGEYGLNLFIENSPDVDPGPIRELMRRISDPRIGVCLDLGHVNYSRVKAAQWIDCLGDRIGYLHLSDNMGQFDDHLPLGQGNCDLTAADLLWREKGRSIPVTLEVGGLEGVRISLDHLRKHGYFE